MTEPETLTLASEFIKNNLPDLEFAIVVFTDTETKLMINIKPGKHSYSVKDKFKELIADMESGKMMYEK